MNKGSMMLAMNSTVISGTPRQTSMKTTEHMRTTGILDRRPSASRIPSGRDATMPVTATTSVTSNPPHCWVSTGTKPKSVSTRSSTAMTAEQAPIQLNNAVRADASREDASWAAESAAAMASKPMIASVDMETKLPKITKSGMEAKSDKRQHQ